eukprot:CAMPEP_0174833680 /NCGR_PEP_ID=MMETSP1114-20130205/4383_1 /TAXON_ID=312471 /ORGANISM="Neobodo designis, Strain CCAP 1951/1" /LENGTH=243 /DNA_ID=CAMNT_0016067571 /DNA_START=6 /DNA_END=733 /DNA_ORIENTATION=-
MQVASTEAPLARRSRARPFHELPAAVHHDAYVPFLPPAALPRLRGLCTNSANAAMTHLRDEAARRVVARSAALSAADVPTLAAIRDTGPAAMGDEAVVAACDAELHLPINADRVLATLGRDMPVVVWPHSSPMAGAVRRALQYEAELGDGSWVLSAPDAGVAITSNSSTHELDFLKFFHEYGVVAVRIPAHAARPDSLGDLLASWRGSSSGNKLFFIHRRTIALALTSNNLARWCGRESRKRG